MSAFLYIICVLPFETAFEYIYSTIYYLTGSYGLSLVLMSLCTTVIIAPFMRWSSAVQMREKHIQDVLKPQLELINLESSGAEKHRRVQKLYSRYSYHPIYSIRSALGVLIQVPFLLGAYYMLRNFDDISGQSFLFIADLSRPDVSLFGLNLLPILMTVINMYSACITPGFGGRETLRAWIIALLFLLILYSAPSALLIFWTCNNFWGLLTNKRMRYVLGDEKTPLERFGEALKFFPKLHLNPSFFGMAYMTLFLLTLQSAITFYLSEYDRKAAVSAHALSFLLLICSTRLFLHEKRRYLCFLIPTVIWGYVLNSYFLMLSASAEAHPAVFRYFYSDIQLTVEHFSHELLHENIYLTQFAGAVALLLFCRKTRYENVTTKVSASCYLMIFFATALSASLQAVNNISYLTVWTTLVYYGLFLSFAMILLFVVVFLGKSLISRDDAGRLTAVFMFVLLMNPTFQMYFTMYGGTTIVFAAILTPIVFFVSLKRTGKWVMGILAASVLLMTLHGIFNLASSDYSFEVEAQNDAVAVFDEKEAFVEIKEKDRASVFLLVYDSIPDLKTLDALNVDTRPLMTVLRNNDFKIYDSTYSIANTSLESMYRTFQISDSSNFSIAQKQRMCAGDSTAHQIFSANGYSLASIQGASMTGAEMFVDEYWPPYEISYETNSVFTLIRGIFSGEFRFDAGGLVDFDDLTYHDFLRNKIAVKEDPWFTSMHVWLPGHSQNSGRLLPNETELFVERLNAALPRIEEDIITILKNNASAVIIIIGDHGPYLTGDGTALNGYAPEEISELMIRDRFGTLVAIRWPDSERAAKYDKDLTVNQDIFSVVFAYLADSPEPLKLMIKEKKAVMKKHVFIDNGVFIPAQR